MISPHALLSGIALMHVAKTLCFRFLCSLAVVLAVCTTTVSAKTVECDAVDTIAKVGLRSFDTVTISADTSNMVCKFSVNGVAVGSPPPEDVENAYRGLVGTLVQSEETVEGRQAIVIRPNTAVDSGFVETYRSLGPNLGNESLFFCGCEDETVRLLEKNNMYP